MATVTQTLFGIANNDQTIGLVDSDNNGITEGIGIDSFSTSAKTTLLGSVRFTRSGISIYDSDNSLRVFLGNFAEKDENTSILLEEGVTTTASVSQTLFGVATDSETVGLVDYDTDGITEGVGFDSFSDTNKTTLVNSIRISSEGIHIFNSSGLAIRLGKLTTLNPTATTLLNETSGSTFNVSTTLFGDTGVDLTDGGVASASSGKRIEIKNNGISIYDAGETLSIIIGDLSILGL
jgi:hypothetical protein